MAANFVKNERVVNPRRLASAIMKLDPCIIGLVLTNNEGEILAAAGPKGPSIEHLDSNSFDRYGTLMSVVLGISEEAAKVFGEFEFILSTFREGKVLLINLRSPSIRIGLLLLRSANGEYLYHRIIDNYRSLVEMEGTG